MIQYTVLHVWHPIEQFVEHVFTQNAVEQYNVLFRTMDIKCKWKPKISTWLDLATLLLTVRAKNFVHILYDDAP
jgi:hypothetical protein